MKTALYSALFCCSLQGVAMTAASAQESYPEGPVTIVVPFSPGGATDTTARLLAEQMSKDSGYRFIVENKPGAGGSIAAGYVARSKPDGYTILFGTSNTNGINSYIYPDLPYDAIESFSPVGFVAENVVVLLANSSFPADTLGDAIQTLKADPGKYSYGSPSVGTVHHLAMELLSESEGLDVLHVPYKGAGPAMVDLVAGNIPLMVGGIAPAAPFIESGKIKLLGVANDRRFKGLPENIQYFSDVSPNNAVSSWMGLLAPKGTPQNHINALSEVLKKALNSSDLTQKLEQQGMQSEYMSPEDFSRHISNGMEFWKSAVKAASLEQN